MDLAELVARESVRDLVARYNANGDSGRVEQVLALFAPDGVLETDGVAHPGRAAIGALFAAAAADLARRAAPVVLRHHTATTQVDVVAPGRATARSYYAVLLGPGLDHWGRYLDDAAEVDGRWVFTRRRELLDGVVAGGWAASTLAPGDPRLAPGG